MLCYLHKHDCVLRRIKLDTLVFGAENNVNDLRMTDLMFFNYTDKIEEEHPSLIEQVMQKNPESLFLGALTYADHYDHSMSSPELLPPVNMIK